MRNGPFRSAASCQSTRHLEQVVLEMLLRSGIDCIELCLSCSQWDVVPYIYSVFAA
jgi:hypothetical protein